MSHQPVDVTVNISLSALFGRPPIIHLRDCDVTEPNIVDDENLTPEGVKDQSNETTSRICAFVAAIRLHVILEVCFIYLSAVSIDIDVI